MQNFRVHIPTEILFGEEKLSDFVLGLKKYGSRILLITGGGSLKSNNFYQPVLALLRANELEVFEFQGIEPNPLNTTIDRCYKENVKNQVDLVLAFGGGSVMDAAKAISGLLYLDKSSAPKSLKREIWPYVLGNSLNGRLSGALPIATIPTTAATASEVTPYAVISNEIERGKAPLNYEFFKPVLSFLNPEYTTRLPKNVTADGAADILSHVLENYLLGGDQALVTDKYCEAIMSSVIETLPKILKDPFNVNARANLMWCSTLALNGMHSAGRKPTLFVLHAIEHAMSAVRHDLAHGRGLATLYPAYFRWLWNNNRARDRLARLGHFLFCTSPKSEQGGLYFIENFERWLRSCGLLQSTKALGFSESDYEYIAKYVIKTYGAGKPLEVLGEMKESDIVDLLRLTESQDE